ncbi:MAG: hypothetical protein JW888_13345, partial [Pirellulales bacterium]|nr:hypothetical protein [Pirellulales bacterium]
MRLPVLKIVFVLLAILMFAAHAHAQTDFYWTGTTGYVDVPENWGSSFAIPGNVAGDNATINNGGTAQVDGSHLFGGTLGFLNVGDTTGAGNISQNGGAVATTSSVFIGSSSGTSSYELLDGTCTMGGWSAIGNGTTGSMTIGQTGSTATPSLNSPV